MSETEQKLAQQYTFSRYGNADDMRADMLKTMAGLLDALHEVLKETCDVTVGSHIRSDRAYSIARSAIAKTTGAA